MKRMTALMKKITWCVIFLIKVNYTAYNYKSYKSTWTSLVSGTHMNANGFYDNKVLNKHNNTHP